LKLAMSGAMRYEQMTWRDRCNAALSPHFARLRVRATRRTHRSKSLRAQEWLLVEWPKDNAEPLRYLFSTAPAEATLQPLVLVTLE
jgi:SRSO17 transposase